MGSFSVFFFFFQQRGHLYSIPGSQVSYSAPLQVMSGPWKVLQINLSWCFEGNLTSMHSSFHSNNYKGIVRGRRRKKKKERKKKASCALPLSFSLVLRLCLSVDEYGNVMGKEDMATKYNSGSFSVLFFFFSSFFSWAVQDSEKARWVTGHEKRLLWNSCFLWAGPSYVCLLFPDEISARFQWGILSHLDWFTFIAFIAQIRGKWLGTGGRGPAPLLKRN